MCSDCCSPLKSGIKHFDARRRRSPADLADRLREDAGAAVCLVVAIDRRNHRVLEAHGLHRLGDSPRLIEVELGRLAMRDRAVRARARADVAENHERRRAVVPAFADVRAMRVLAHGIQLQRRA